MGCNDDPRLNKEELDRLKRWSKLKKELENIPLSAFAAADLDALLRVLGLHPSFRCLPEHLDLIEKKIKSYHAEMERLDSVLSKIDHLEKEHKDR